jgi:hypothetical protein
MSFKEKSLYYFHKKILIFWWVFWVGILLPTLRGGGGGGHLRGRHLGGGQRGHLGAAPGGQHQAEDLHHAAHQGQDSPQATSPVRIFLHSCLVIIVLTVS